MELSVRDLYLVRHGQSLANVGLDAGVDSALSPAGRAEAARCAEFLAGRLAAGRTLLLSSPFRRAVQTADLIAARCGLGFRLEPALHELFLAEWFPPGERPMLPLRELAAQFPRVTGEAPDGGWWPEQPEDMADVLRRASGLRNRLLGREFAEPIIVCVSHAGLIAALAECLDPELVLEEIGNASVTHVRWDGEAVRALLRAERGFLTEP